MHEIQPQTTWYTWTEYIKAAPPKMGRHIFGRVDFFRPWRFDDLTFLSTCRADPATGTFLRRSAPVSAPTDGKAVGQAHPAVDSSDVVREEEDATGVLVQCAKEQGWWTIQVHPSLGATLVRRIERGTGRMLVDYLGPSYIITREKILRGNCYVNALEDN